MSGNGNRRRDAILSPDPLVAADGSGRPLVGVLALQGDFREHRLILERLGAATREVRQLRDLEGLDGLVIPGGESTTIGKLMVEYDLLDGIRAFAHGGKPIYGTCAGLITLAHETVEQHDQPLLDLIDVVARRNAFGRQVHSFEADLRAPAFGERALHAVFIRAPWIESAGPGVDVLAEHQGHGVAAVQRDILVTAFHPELTDDTRVHEYFLSMVRRRKDACGEPAGAHCESREEVVS